MHRLARLVPALALCAMTALGLTACGGSSGSSGSGGSGGGGANGSITILQGTAPDSLDPGFDYTTQAAEPDWISYTPLVTYAHKEAAAGTQLIPGLATSLPTVAPDGLTYSLTLRKGLTYSNGKPVKASDFPASIERTIKIGWGGKSFFTSYIKGAAAYDKGSASSISGIKADDVSGKITISLLKPYGAFANVLAFPAAALVPATEPKKNEPNNPPPGVGPYMITSVTPNQGYTLKRNPAFAKFGIAGIPTDGVATINVKIQSNTNAEAQQVLSNQADVFDPADTLPPALVSQIQGQASDRFKKVSVPTTYYNFLNTKTKPFNDPRAREAVNLAIDRRAFARLASGFMQPGCYFLPPGIPGHNDGGCPGINDPAGAPNVAKAKQLISQAGLTGTPVTVWSETRQPRQQFMTYYTSVLNSIGLKATQKVIADASYFSTIGNAKTPNVQTGFADWQQDFPNPSDFYLLLDCNSIQPINNQNFSQVCDSHNQSELKILNAVPATKLSSVASRWAALDKYMASKYYVAAYGYGQDPKFMSNRVDFGAAVSHPLYLLDWSTLKLK